MPVHKSRKEAIFGAKITDDDGGSRYFFLSFGFVDTLSNLEFSVPYTLCITTLNISFHNIMFFIYYSVEPTLVAQ